jgi:hypothetical protein
MFPPCLIQAAHAYAVPAAQLERIVETTAARRARGRAVGLGPAGIQPGWLPVLRQAGFPVAQLATHTCANLKAAAWILREAQSLNKLLRNRHAFLQVITYYIVITA